MDTALTDRFCRHALASFGKQLHLADLIGSLNWHVDLTNRLLSFEDKYRWHAQLLGTESEQAGTWLWAWANPSPGITPELLQASQTMKELGEKEGIEEFTEVQVPLDEISGHFLSLIASGVCQADAYYRGPYKGGAAFLLIKDDSFPACTTQPLVRLSRVFPEAISSIDIPDHKLALLGYLEYHNLAGEVEGDRVVVKTEGKPVLTATFDEQNRLTELETTLDGDKE